jgi:hypothetical protein
MDNEGLLAWSEHEVGKAREALGMATTHMRELREALGMATTHMRELREIVRLENKAKQELAEYLTFLKTLGIQVEGDIHI